MSTSRSDEIKATPSRSDGKECVLVGVDGMSVNGKKKTRPTAGAGRVPSDLSLGWSPIMITGDTEDVNTNITSKKNTSPTAGAGQVPSDLSLGSSLFMITGDAHNVNT